MTCKVARGSPLLPPHPRCGQGQAISLKGQAQLRLRLKFKARTPQGKELLPETEIVLQRDLSFNESVVLAKDAEEALLYRDMQNDAVQQLLRRLQLTKLNSSPATP